MLWVDLISRTSLRVKKEDIEKALLLVNGKPDNSLLYEVANYIQSYFGDDNISMETFINYYNATIQKIGAGLKKYQI